MKYLHLVPCADEAHKGSGDYAYATVVRFLMAKNPHFRVLALTATPGSKPEAVQAIVDALHISRIEIRDEQSWDIRGYINHKVCSSDSRLGLIADRTFIAESRAAYHRNA